MAHSDLLKLALARQRAGQLAEAEQAFRQFLAIAPGHFDAWLLLGVVAIRRGNYEYAAQCIQQAIQIDPTSAEAYSNLGIALYEQGMMEQAEACHRRAIELNPEYAAAYGTLGNLLKRRAIKEAVDCYRKAIELDASLTDVHVNLAIALKVQGKLDEAALSYAQALRLDPNHAKAHNNLGTIFRDHGRYDDALDCDRRAVAINPDYAPAHFNPSLIMLVRGEFQSGWQEFDYRLRRAAPQPYWDGSDIRGKRILLAAEQGIGDTIQFVRYAPLVKQRGATVILKCQPRLIPLLKTCQGVDEVVTESQFDVQAPLLSLPRIFETTIETIPTKVPYLSAPLAEHWGKRLNELPGLKVGIAWQGNPEYPSDGDRSIDLAHFAVLSGATLISLQKGPGTEQLADATFPVVDLGVADASGAFMDTAAIMEHLDLVITSDTSIAHLAGALGRPVWVALPFVPDWRWMLERSDSPWYPTMRLFRQRRPGDWRSVFDAIRSALCESCLPRINL